jgi:hypothetical protein
MVMSEYNRENMDKWRRHADGTTPTVPMQSTPEKLGNKIAAEYQRFIGHTVSLDRSDGNDPTAGRDAVQSEVNYNHLLDHYPNGAPRDFIVQYADTPGMVTDRGELVVPENVVLGD